MSIHDAVSALYKYREEALQSRIKQSPVHSNRASNCGHPCIAYHVFYRTQWNQRRIHGAELQQLFETGTDLEPHIIEKLRKDCGILISRQQRPLWDEHLKLSGHIDGEVELVSHEELTPLVGAVVEVKTVSAYFTMKTLDELKAHPFFCRYPTQICLYMYLNSKPHGLLVFYNRSSGEMSYMAVILDEQLDYIEGILQKLEAVNAHVDAKTKPEAKFMPDFCPSCDFEHICLPPRIHETQLEFIEDPEIEDLLCAYFFFQPHAKEFKDVDLRLKEQFRGLDGVRICGGYKIEGKQQRNGWRMKIDALDKKNG